MKPSTLFGIAGAVLLGLTVVSVARYKGLFETPPPEPSPKRPSVLVASRNLFKGVGLQQHDVRVRELRADELDHYLENREDYLPAVSEAASARVLIRCIEADRPILRSDLEVLSLPDGPSGHLEKDMQAVNVAIPKDRSAGGLIRVGERVDVLLSCHISNRFVEGQETTRTAPIARRLRVVFKRNRLWSGMAKDPEDRPINFTLEANAYRAALITYAKNKGHLSLVPSSARREVDEIDRALAEEDWELSRRLRRGDLVVGDRDLERIFRLQPIPDRALQTPVAVELYTGITRRGYSVFDAEGRPAPVHPWRGQPPRLLIKQDDEERRVNGGSIVEKPDSPEPSGSLGYSFAAPPLPGGESGSRGNQPR